MKKVYSVVALMTLSISSFAQVQFDNPGFETWDNVTTNNREPQEWNSIKTGGGNASTPNFFVVDRSTDIASGVSGTYSCKIETKFYIVTSVNGVLTNGRVEAPTFSAADGYNRTKPDDSNFYTAMVDKPDSLVVWVKYAPVSNDNGRFQCILHNVVGDGLTAGNMGTLPETGNSQGNNTAQTIANAEATIANTNGSWERVSVPFAYANANTPEYILFTATSSAVPGGGSTGSIMYVDNVALIYNVTPVLSANTVQVSGVQGAALDVDFSTGGTPIAATDFNAELSDASGSFASPTVIGTLNTAASSGTINATVPAGTPIGTGYKVRVTNASEYYQPIEESLTVESLTVGIADASSDNVRVFGNQGQLTIDLRNSEITAAAYELFTVSGQRMAVGSLTSGLVNTVNGVETGVYVLRMVHSNGITVSKVLVN